MFTRRCARFCFSRTLPLTYTALLLPTGESHNRLVDLVRHGLDGKPTASVVELEWPNYYYFGKEGTMVHAEAADEEEDVAAMHEAFEELGEDEEVAKLPEQSLLQFFVSKGLSSRVLDLADAIFANDYGADASDVGLHEVIHEQRCWNHGEKYLVLRDACIHDAMTTLAKGIDVRTDWPVDTIRVSPQASTPAATRVLLTNASGRSVAAGAAIVTVPLAALQAGEVRFEPPLPSPHASAIGALRMGSALKVVVRLRERFWPLDFYDAVCSDCFFPEVWLSQAAKLMDPACPPPYAIVGFVAGARAERVAKLPEREIVRKLLLQLDTMFGTADRPHPASDSCEAYLVKDWKPHPRTHGAYSHPTLRANGQRAALGSTAHSAILFAGEASHQGVNPCVHGAMETGELAAERASALLKAERSGARSRL